MEYLDLSHSGSGTGDFSLYADTFVALQKRLSDASHDHSYRTPYHFVSFVTDTALLEKLKSIYSQFNTTELKKIFIVGIGGANLSAEAMINAFPRSMSRSFVFLDTLYAGERDDIAKDLSELKHKNECLIIVISKSGKTIETLENAELLTSLTQERWGDVSTRTIVMSEEGTSLAQWAVSRKAIFVPMPRTIGDRFSAFSPLCVLPMMFAGLDVDAYFQGAQKALDMNTKRDVGPAWQSSLALHKQMKRDSRMTLDFFFFSKRLETFGKWHRQLFAESLGKSVTLLGTKNVFCITPTVSVGTTDLHSVFQLYLAEPEGRFAWFLEVIADARRSLEEDKSFGSFLFDLAGNTPEHTVATIYKSIVDEYARHRIPFIESKVDAIDEASLGFIMMNAYCVVLGLAQLWNVDPFIQPEVESYKEAVRVALRAEPIHKVALKISRK